MKIQEINAFLAICEYGSFTRAAEKTFTTQPTISWQISSLEKELGHQLIIRGKGIHQTTLTSAGRLFRGQAEKWARLWAETELLLSEDERILYQFACNPSFVSFVFPKVSHCFSRAFPQCELHLSSHSSPTVCSLVERGVYDSGLACALPPTSQLQCTPIAKEPFVFICREDADYDDEVRISDLLPSNEVVNPWVQTIAAWRQHHFPNGQKPLLVITAVTSVTDYFTVPNAWSIVPVSCLSNCSGYRICRLKTLPPHRIIHLVSRYPVREPFYSELKQSLCECFKAFPDIELLVK